MKHGGKIAFCLVVGLAGTAGVRGLTAEGELNPYRAIVDRNVFNLRPAPVISPTNSPPVIPPSTITLLGIVSGFGPKQVMFRVKAGTPPKDVNYTVPEGERQDDFEVLEINEDAGSVRIKNRNEEQLLTLEKDGLKPSAGPVPVVPGALGMPRIPPPRPGAGVPALPTTSGIPAPAGGSTVTTFGAGAVTRPLRGAAATAGAGRVASFGAGVTPTPTIPQSQQPALTPEEQIVAMEVMREKTKQQVAEGLMPPLPPTPLTPPTPK